jgi:hypothetical protein
MQKVLDVLTDKGKSVAYVPEHASEFIREQDTPELLAQHIRYRAGIMGRFANDYFQAAQCADKPFQPDEQVREFAGVVEQNADKIASQLMGANGGMAAGIPSDTTQAEAMSILFSRKQASDSRSGARIRVELVDEHADALAAQRKEKEDVLLRKALGVGMGVGK